MAATLSTGNRERPSGCRSIRAPSYGLGTGGPTGLVVVGTGGLVVVATGFVVVGTVLVTGVVVGATAIVVVVSDDAGVVSDGCEGTVGR
jgi:hypothetical protein